ncbi:MAG: hypothetical protein RLW61_11375 [Gammaproteobacteria bacterium]
MKRTTISLAVAALCSQAAYAVPQSGTTTRVVIGGATATEVSLVNAIVDNLCAAGSDIDVFRGADHTNVACEVDSSFAPAGTTVLFSKNSGGSAQGATSLVVPVAVEVLSPSSTCVVASVPVQSTPKGTSYDAWVCDGSGGSTQVLENLNPDWGLADVEPELFKGPLGIAGEPFPEGASIDSRSTAALTFGLVATTSLYQALQAVQFPADSDCNPDAALGGTDDGSVLGSIAGDGIRDQYQAYATDGAQPVNFDAVTGLHIPETPDSKGYADQPHRMGDTRACMPTVSLTEARAMLRGDMKTWEEYKVGSSNLFASAAGKPWAPDPGVNNFVLCRRVQGSGTHATISSQILATNCSSGGSVMVEAGFDFPRIVLDNQGSSNMGECLDDLETKRTNEQGLGVKAWGVGYQSTEKNPDLEEAFRFLKIDGQSPDLKNFVEGDYWIFGPTTMNRRGASDYFNPVGFFPAVDLMFERVVAEISDPANLVDLNAGLQHPFGVGGFAGTNIAGVDTLPGFPFNPDPVAGDPPLTALTHTNPDTGRQDMCFGPVLRSVGGTVTARADEEDSE